MPLSHICQKHYYTARYDGSEDLFQLWWWIHFFLTSSLLSIAPSSPSTLVVDVFTRNPLPLPHLLGKTNLGQSLLLNEFYSDKLLPFLLQQQLQSTQTSPQTGTPPHSLCDWLQSLTLQHLWSPIGPSSPVMLWLAGLQGVLFLWDGCRGAQEDLCAHREIPTNLSQAGRLPKQHVGGKASKLKGRQSFPISQNLCAHLAATFVIIYQFNFTVFISWLVCMLWCRSLNQCSMHSLLHWLYCIYGSLR